jgi:hypothetical protein
LSGAKPITPRSHPCSVRPRSKVEMGQFDLVMLVWPIGVRRFRRRTLASCDKFDREHLAVTAMFQRHRKAAGNDPVGLGPRASNRTIGDFQARTQRAPPRRPGSSADLPGDRPRSRKVVQSILREPRGNERRGKAGRYEVRRIGKEAQRTVASARRAPRFCPPLACCRRPSEPGGGS